MADRAEIAKQVERAEKLLQKGKPADALDIYLHVVAADPDNDTVRQMAADLCLSLQRTPDAIRLLGELFERQIQAGDATRASLTYKKLARFINPTWEQKVRFGQLLEGTNRKQAAETYETALEELIHQGRKSEGLGVLQLILALDESEQNLKRLGEMSAETGDHQAAAHAFLKLAEAAAKAGTNSAQWYERAYAENPADQRIALAYSRSLGAPDQIGAAIFILAPHLQAGSAPPEFREVYAKALLGANRLTDVEPILWQLFEEDPARIPEVAGLLEKFIDNQQDAEAVALARKLEQHQRRKGDRRTFIAMMQEIIARHRASPDLLEFMSEVFNSSNREGDYCQTLLKLFDLHFGMGNFAKAAECLDKAAEVDAYEPGHQKRLESLRGKIDDNRFKVISSRFTSMTPIAPVRNEERTLGSATLQDLMLQAEILVQYGMRTKAVERLQRIQELFPHEEERNQDLAQLYMTAGLTPQYAPAAASTPSAVTPPVAPQPPRAAEADVANFTRVAEITRKLYRQPNSDAVLSTTVGEIGSQWVTTRCFVALRKPGQAVSATREFCASGLAAGSPKAFGQLAALTHDVAISRGSVTASDAQNLPELQPVRDALSELSVASLLALPLNDGSDHVGVLLLMQNTVRSWSPSDVMVLKTIAEQVVIALNNVGLRRLVKSLSVTDERSGLLKRASYLDLLLAETRRGVQQNTPATILLLKLAERASLIKEFGEQAVVSAMQQVGQIFARNIRQNDLAFRYDSATIAIILGSRPRNAAEVINRAEQAGAESVASGPGSIRIVSAALAAAAVA